MSEQATLFPEEAMPFNLFGEQDKVFAKTLDTEPTREVESEE